MDYRALGNNAVHGHCRRKAPRARSYNAWCYMRTRCLNPNREDWHLYGGRGVTICPEWLESYANFLRDMGECPEGKTLDRVDPNGNYEPSNCRWATSQEQAESKRTNVWIAYEGQRLTVSQWARQTGLPYQVLADRIRHWGSDLHRVFTTPYVGLNNPVETKCQQCGKDLVTYRSNKRFCGDLCRANFNAKATYVPRRPKTTERNCAICGTTFAANREWQKYCSKVCQNKRFNKSDRSNQTDDEVKGNE